MARPTSLSVTVPKKLPVISSDIKSRPEAESRSPSPREANLVSTQTPVFDATQSPSMEGHTNSPELTSLPPFPSSPKQQPKHAREPSKGFFSNLKASKSSQKVFQVEPTIRQVSEEIPRSNLDFTEHSIYSIRKSPGSTPDLSLTNTLEGSFVEAGEDQGDRIYRRPVGSSVNSEDIVGTPTESAHSRKPKPRFGTLLQRTRSTRLDDMGLGRRSKPTTPINTAAPEIRTQFDRSAHGDNHTLGPMTAPLHQDRSLQDLMSANPRNRSADRQPSRRDRSQENMPMRRGEKASNGGLRESGGSHLLTNIKNTSSKAADGLGKASKGFFGKISRSGSSNARDEEPPVRYVCTIINLPLIEQTRRTRIAQRIERSRDKTEFWMPAFPWRCIDFLNHWGCEEEGLYRVPGSAIAIREWQRRFDQEGDIDLLAQQDLKDINIVGSMFKAWLRELPTEILPKAVQDKIATECHGAREVPQLLRDELSSLPPWNYYLLFATTCHLSLLVDCAETNKMTYHNLCVCFQPALRIDAFCFNFLVQHWRDCWQGCWTEKEALEAEYRVLDGGLPSGGSGANSLSDSHSSGAMEERSLASASSHKASIGGGRANQVRPPPLTLTQPSEEQLVTATRGMHIGSRNGHVRPSTQLPELEPMMPLSPIGSHFN